jgi:hypothetical protein
MRVTDADLDGERGGTGRGGLDVGGGRDAGRVSERVPRRLAGVVTTGELIAGGLSSARIRTLVGRGVLVPVWRGVYARATAAAALAGQPGGDHALHVAAAVAVTGREATGSHHSAALIHRLDLLDGAPQGVTTVTRPPDAPGSRAVRAGIRLHTAALPDGHVLTLADGGLRVTSVARTVVDLARRASFGAGVVTADSALHAGQTSVRELRAALAACACWPGIERARRVVGFSDGRSESVLESLARVAFSEQGLPPPDLQVWVGADGEVAGRADFLWREYRTVGEADGALKYQDPASVRARFWRDAKLREAGFEVVHFGWDEIVRVPHQVAASIRAAFRREARRPAG